MFARKKTADVQTSLQRFCDLHRDVASRAKHFRLAIELLSSQDKRQLVDDFNFETFHLIDSLLLHPDLCVDAQLVYDAESALWTLEQVLCFAPELVGKGWQRNAIESILKRALLPRNLMAVRKIAIRLFLIWYQTLAVYGNTTRTLDTVFQCCLPFFPLRSRQQSEQILQAYCECSVSQGYVLNGGGFEPGPLKTTPIIVDGSVAVAPSANPATISENMGVRERAQILQIYLDKFLEYCCRETMKIEWSDESKRLNCAKFILDRVIMLYIAEIFPDIENNGVDVFGGWEGGEESTQVLDTADPVVIARYWLIRWMTNIAVSPMTEGVAPGLLLYRQALLSSQKATNSLLTLMRMAMQLPLACSNVIHKVISLARCWLLQRDIPPFVDSGLVSLEAWNVLLIHSLLSFFKSVYLRSSGDRLPAAVSLTHSILAVVSELANPAAGVLPRPLPLGVWAELMRCLSDAVLLSCSRTDAFGSATAAFFTRTLLSVTVYVRVIREVELDDKIWDDIWLVFRTAVWTQVVEQWSKFVEIMTRALILNLFAIDVNQFESGGNICGDTSSTGSSTVRRHGVSARTSVVDRVGGSDNGSVVGGEGGFITSADDEDHSGGAQAAGSENGEKCGEKDFQSVIQSTGNVYLWLRSWMRIVNLVDPAENVQQIITSHPAGQRAVKNNQSHISSSAGSGKIVGGFSHQREAVQTLARAMDILLRCQCANALVHWLAARLLNGITLNEQPHAIAPLCAVLNGGGKFLPEIHRAHILLNLRMCLASGEENDVESVSQLVMEQMPQMGVEDLTVLSSETVSTLQKLLKNTEFSARAVRVAALLSLNHTEVEKILVSLLESPSVEVDFPSLVLCINALCIVILERADEQLFNRLSISIANHKRSNELLPIFCSNLGFVTRVGLGSALADLTLRGILDSANNRSQHPSIERYGNDLKWQLCALSARDRTLKSWRSLIECFETHRDQFLEGIVWQLAFQYPLPGFAVSQWNSQSCVQTLSQPTTDSSHQISQNPLSFMDTEGAVLSFDKNEDNKFLWSRTVVGKHCYTVDSLDDDVEPESDVNIWLTSLSKRSESSFSSNRNFSNSSNNVSNRIDPFKELPRPVVRWNGSGASTSSETSSPSIPHRDTTADIAEMLRFIQFSSLTPENVADGVNCRADFEQQPCAHQSTNVVRNVHANWRQFFSDFCLVQRARDVSANFHRELRHLDSTMSREVHKVAVIYVGRDQEDKQSILSNSSASETFNAFVERLGWLVQIGSPGFFGYTGGLPQGQLAPYFASANTELIFHVSTLITGDVTQKMKHLGNDEVHVVWSEHSKPYRRELIATRFCDVLIVLYQISPVLVRVHIETQDPDLMFGPLFDGAFLHITQVANLVRETVLNASRAYRNSRLDCDRPNKHRENVFHQTKSQLKHLPLGESIVRLYAPTPN